MVDCTGSMSSYILQAKESIKKIMTTFSEKYDKKDAISFAFVGYRDHFLGSSGWDPDYPVSIQNFTTNDICYNFIEGVTANGGADLPEAVVDGFKAMTEIDW